MQLISLNYEKCRCALADAIPHLTIMHKAIHSQLKSGTIWKLPDGSAYRFNSYINENWYSLERITKNDSNLSIIKEMVTTEYGTGRHYD